MQKNFIKQKKQIAAIFIAIVLMVVTILTVSHIDVKASSTTAVAHMNVTIS